MTLNDVTLQCVNSGNLFGILVYIQAFSRVRIKFRTNNITLEEGETITGYSVIFKGQSYTANSSGNVTTDGGVSAGDNEIICTAHGLDANGNEISSTITKTVTAYAYNPPAGEYALTRCDAQGNEDDNGGYFKITPTLVISDCGGNIVGTSSVRYKLRSASTYTEAGSTTGDTPLVFGGDIQLARSYDIMVTLSDTAGFSKEYSLTAFSNYWAMRFSSDGTGVSFGQNTASSNALELASGMSFKMGSTSMSEAQLSALLSPAAAGGFSVTTIWTNPSPTSTYASQTLVVDLSAYKMLIVQFKQANNIDIYSYAVNMIDGTEHMVTTSSKTGTAYTYKRTMKCSSTGIVFSSGYRSTSAGAAYMVPYRIYGIK